MRLLALILAVLAWSAPVVQAGVPAFPQNPAYLSAASVGSGTQGQAAHALVLDAVGNIYVGGRDRAFVTKFDPSGTLVLYRVHFGSLPGDSVDALAADAAGNVYATGASEQGGFLAELDPHGERLFYRTLPAAGVAVALDAAGDLYYATGNSVFRLDAVARKATPVDGPDGGTAQFADTAAVQAPGLIRAIAATAAGVVYAAGAGFVARLNGRWDGWEYVLPLGSTEVHALALDASGVLYAAGVAGREAFAARIRPDGAGFDWRTTLAVDGTLMPYALAIDPRGSVLVAGDSAGGLWSAGVGTPARIERAPGTPPVPPAPGRPSDETPPPGRQDAGASYGFLARLDAGGNLLDSTEVGPSRHSHVRALALDAAGQIYAAGWVEDESPDVLLTRFAETNAPFAATAPPAIPAAGSAAASTRAARTLAAPPRASASAVTPATSSLLVGTDSGTKRVGVATSGSWTANTSDVWLHLNYGANNASLIIGYDANTSAAPRTGTINFNSGAATLTVTQAGAGYVPVNLLGTVISGGLVISPYALALDSAGNIYFADVSDSTIKKWTAATLQLTTVVSSGLNLPHGLAMDIAGNLYISDSGNNAIKKWTASTQQVTPLISSGLSNPGGLAVDGFGNIYIADTGTWRLRSGRRPRNR